MEESTRAPFSGFDNVDVLKSIEILRTQQQHPEISEYQIKVVLALSEKKNSLNQLPTGSGKTLQPSSGDPCFVCSSADQSVPISDQVAKGAITLRDLTL